MTPTELKQLRHSLGLSQREMTEAMGLKSYRSVQRMEAGEQPIEGAVLRVLEYMQKYGLLTKI